MFNNANQENDSNKDQSSNYNYKNSQEFNGTQEELTISKLNGDSPVPKKSEIFNGAQSGNSMGFSSFVREYLFLTPPNPNASIQKTEGKLNRPPTLAPFSDYDLLKCNKLTNFDTLVQSVGGDFPELITRDGLNYANNHQFGDFGLTANSIFVDPNGYLNNNNTFLSDVKDIPSKFKDSTNLLNSSIIHNEYFKKQLEILEEQNKLKEEKLQQEKQKQQQTHNSKQNGQGEGTDCEVQNGENDSDNANDEQKPKEGCRCRNSKCLKLYCECFSKGAYCRDICKCLQCNNKEEFEADIREAKKATLTRNPDAFTSKLEVVGTIAQDEDIDANKGMLGYKKGCKCKKTYCKKKYCECYNAGVKCSYLCICENCHNQEDDPSIKDKDGNANAQEQVTHKNPNHSGGVVARTQGQSTNSDAKVPSDQSLDYNTQQYSTAKKKIKSNQQNEHDTLENNQLSTDEKNCAIPNFQFTPNFNIHGKSLNIALLKNTQYSDFNFNS